MVSGIIGGWWRGENGSKGQFGGKTERMYCLIRCGVGEREGREEDGSKKSWRRCGV